MQPKVPVLVGACSGIAQAVQRELAGQGKELLLVARSEERLEALRQDLLLRGSPNVLIFVLDLDDTSRHIRLLQFAQSEFPDFDVVLIAGLRFHAGPSSI